MGTFDWAGRQIGPTDLFGAAREARGRDWLDEPARRFLHHCGICLATDRTLSECERVELEILLGQLQHLGSSVLPPSGDALRDRPHKAELAQLESDLAALRFFLAASSERVEAYWNRLQRLKQGLPPEPQPLGGD